MTNPVLLKIAQSATLTEAEVACLSGILDNVVELAPGQDLARQGDRPRYSTVLLEGMSYRYCGLPDGARSTMAFNIAGDWVDVQSLFLRALDHSVGALTACKVAQIPHARLIDAARRVPQLGLVLCRESTIDAAIMRQWTVSLGARNARSRMAHLFCEMDMRLRSIGLVGDQGFDFPVSQAHLGEALGISTVHANRVLQQLRSEGAIEFRQQHVMVKDPQTLTAIAAFDPTYLEFQDLAEASAEGA